MSEGRSRRLLVGGRGALRFAVPLEAVATVEEWDALRSPCRVVDLPRLFDLPTADGRDDRYAEIEPLEETAYVRLGPAVRAEVKPAADVQPMPKVLEVVAARWAWRELLLDEEGVTLVVDPAALGRLGARRDGVEA